jgi:radical SAM superfamily enzyme YgiQ (UPF0313 family)
MIERKLKKKWWMQTSINAVDNERLIELAAKSGCIYAFVGFESLSYEMLKGMKKGINLKIGIENYKRVLKVFHKNGIGVLGSFILGNDYESKNLYKEMMKFLVHSGVDISHITFLTPLPGTNLMEQMEKEDRLLFRNFPYDWSKYRFSYMVHQPHGIDIDTIYSGNNYIKKNLYSFPWYQYRLIKSLLSIKNLSNFYVVYKINKAFKKGWLNSHYCQAYSATL